MTNETIAKQFGCTVEQVRRQYRRNSTQLREMAIRNPEKRGFSAGYLNDKADEFEASGKTQTVQIINSAAGDSKEISISTLNQASAAFRKFIDHYCLGASEAGQCIIRNNGAIVAHVSYNGKVWEGECWASGSQPIFDPCAS